MFFFENSVEHKVWRMLVAAKEREGIKDGGGEICLGTSLTHTEIS